MEGKALSLDEHALIGLELCAMRERLRILAIRIDNSYGKPVPRRMPARFRVFITARNGCMPFGKVGI